MREREVPRAESMQHPKDSEGAIDAVPALDTDEAGDATRRHGLLHVVGARGEAHVLRIPGRQAVNKVDLLEGRPDSLIPFQFGRHENGPELRTDAPRSQPREVGLKGRAALHQIEAGQVQAEGLPHRPRHVVVTIEHVGVCHATSLSADAGIVEDLRTGGR